MRQLTVTLFAAVFMTFVQTAAGHAQEGPQENVGVFMRAKLAHSQNVLEGLTTEDFDKIAKSSQELSLLSLAAQWQVLQTPEYVRRSGEFRREVDALKTAAEKKNLDAATLSFLKVTLSCIECHKYVRSVRQARFDNLLLGNLGSGRGQR